MRRTRGPRNGPSGPVNPPTSAAPGDVLMLDANLQPAYTAISFPPAFIEPLSNELWVDQDTTTDPADQDGSIAQPFDSITDAVAAVANNGTATIRVLGYDYSAEAAITLNGKSLTFIGEQIVGSSSTRAILPAFNGAGSLTAIRCQVTSVGVTTAVTNLLLLQNSSCPGNIHVTDTLRLINSSQGTGGVGSASTVLVDGTGGPNVQAVASSMMGTWNIAGGGSGNSNAPQIDEHTLSSLGFNGVQRSDASPDWNVTHQLFAHLTDADRTIDGQYYGVVVPDGTLTATRTITVNQAGLAIGAGFRIDRYDDSNQTVNVTGSTAGTVGLSNAALVKTRYQNINNSAGPTMAFVSPLQRLSSA